MAQLKGSLISSKIIKYDPIHRKMKLKIKLGGMQFFYFSHRISLLEMAIDVDL